MKYGIKKQYPNEMNITHTDYFKSLPPWRSVSVTGVAETAPSDTVDETIRLNHYQSLDGFEIRDTEIAH
jgi:hypothetical protein